MNTNTAFAVGDQVIVTSDPHKTGVIIREIDMNPRPYEFLVLIGTHAVYGLGKDGTLFDTLTGRNTGTVVSKLRMYREFYVLMSNGGQIVASYAEPVVKDGRPVIARLRWYEDGEVVQIVEGK